MRGSVSQQSRRGNPWIRALGQVRTLGINVLNKSPPGLRPWALQPQLSGCVSDHVSTPESREPVVLTHNDTTSPASVVFGVGVGCSTDTLELGEALHPTAEGISWDWLYKIGNWFHHISKLKILFGNISDLRSESLLRATNLKATIYWAYSSCQTLPSKYLTSSFIISTQQLHVANTIIIFIYKKKLGLKEMKQLA